MSTDSRDSSVGSGESVDQASSTEEQRPRLQRRSSDAFSSSSEEYVDDDGEEGLETDDDDSSQDDHASDDALGGEAEEIDQRAEKQVKGEKENTGTPETVSSRPSYLGKEEFVSEFDRALMSGATNTGAASFQGGEFLTQAQESVMDETMTGEDSVNETQPAKPDVKTKSARRTDKSDGKRPSTVPPPGTLRTSLSGISHLTAETNTRSVATNSSAHSRVSRSKVSEDVSEGVLPDVLMTMRQKIESLTLFDSDMMKIAETDHYDDRTMIETRESLKRSSQQSLSAAVLVSLAHKRYERRRLGAMEIEKVIRSLVQQNQVERVKAILLLLSDDYVRSTSEDARKGGVVALAAGAIGLKKAKVDTGELQECRDLILASVVHACQDHSQRVRYYATESLFNVVKVIPTLAVQHFFILFEILRSLYADVDVDVRSGAELLDKKLKEVIVGAINSGSFTATACVPIFARFVHIRNKATKRLTLTWLQELNEKLIGAPVLEFLHLFLGGIFSMIADPNISIRQSALAFLQSVLPKLLMDIEAFDDEGTYLKVDFDKLIQSLVTTLEHPDPFVRKVAMHWMCRIVKRYMSDPRIEDDKVCAASISVKNALPHLLPGLFLSIGDKMNSKASTKDSFLPDQSTYSLAEQTNACLQDTVRRGGKIYISHLDGFIASLREELNSPGGFAAKNPPAVERKPYRVDVKADGTGIESTGWFRLSKEVKEREDVTVMSRLCALEWITVLYESVVPHSLKAEFAREFISPIIHQLVDNPPEQAVFKSLEVLAKITVPVEGERLAMTLLTTPVPAFVSKQQGVSNSTETLPAAEPPMTNTDYLYAMQILDARRGQYRSRDRQVFAALIELHASNHHLLSDLSRVIQYMCTLQPPEFVFVSFSIELDTYIRTSKVRNAKLKEVEGEEKSSNEWSDQPFSSDLQFVSSFVQQMCHVLLNAEEAERLRMLLLDCIGKRNFENERDNRRTRIFQILLHSFSHNLVASTSLCLWAGAFCTVSSFLQAIDPMDINILFLMELDRLVEMLERPLFRHLHLRMIESDQDPTVEGSGAMLFKTLKLILMILPQSTSYRILKHRLVTISRYRQSVSDPNACLTPQPASSDTDGFVERVQTVRKMHCRAQWESIRSESLETPNVDDENRNFVEEEGADRRRWLGYRNKGEEIAAKAKFQEEKRQRRNRGLQIEELTGRYHDFDTGAVKATKMEALTPNDDPHNATEAKSEERKEADSEDKEQEQQWKDYWANAGEER